MENNSSYPQNQDNLNTTQNKGYLSWGVFGVVSAVAIFAWGSGFNWDFSNVNAYMIFPLLGLLAWSTMWTHYFLGYSSHYNQTFKMSQLYKKLTAYLVLGLILLHPGLLAYAQWQNAQLLPPKSFFEYVGSTAIGAIILAQVALLSFLLFEVFIRLKNKPSIRRHWMWVSLSQMLAMVFIFIHSMWLGQNLQTGWFRYYWIGLGLLLIPSFIIVGKKDWQKAQQAKSTTP